MNQIDLGYPNFELPKWYGLWCPVLDCFMLVHPDINLLLEIQLLSSSKILTVPVELDVELAQQNLLDNQCCIQWTVVDPEKVNFTFIYQKPNQIWPVSVQPSQLRDLAEVEYVQQWFMFLLEWVHRVRTSKIINNRVKNFICNIMEMPNVDIKQKIYKVLLLAKDQAQAQQELAQIIEQYEL